MQSTASTADEYVASLTDDRRGSIAAIRATINANLPKGFEECMASGMINWVVPHSLYPAGYHCNPSHPLPFMGVASQKRHIALYSMCLYGSSDHLDWFKTEWAKHATKKLDMGKSCIRFSKPADVPLDLIGKLAKRVSPEQWIAMYEASLRR